MTAGAPRAAPDADPAAETKPARSGPRFPTGWGQGDTRIKSGQPYPTIGLAEIRAMAAVPPALPKAGARWFIPSTFAGHDVAEVLRYAVPPVTAETRFPAWERIVARRAMALLGAATTLRTLAEAVSGSATNLDYEDFILRLADLADDRERAALPAEDGEAARWIPAGDLIADSGCNEALIRLLTKKGVAPALRPNNLPTQLAAFRDQAAGGYRLRMFEMLPIPKKPGEKPRKRTFWHFTAEPTD